MSEKINTQENIAFYTQRSGEDVKRALYELERSPDHLLSPEERDYVLRFEDELFQGVYRQEGVAFTSGLDKDLEKIDSEGSYGTKVNGIAVEFLAEPEAEVFLRDLGVDTESATTAEERFQSLQTVAFSADKPLQRKLSTKSLAWARITTTDALINGEQIPEIHKERLFNSSTELVTKLTNVGQYRAFLLDVRKDLKAQPEDNVTPAMRDITDIYLKVVNGTLAGIFPDALSLWKQAKDTNDDETIQKLKLAWPNIESIANLSDEGKRKYVVGLDRIRNGVALEDGSFTSVTDSLRTLAHAQLEDEKSHEELQEAVFTPQEVQRLSEMKLDAKGMQQFCEGVLSAFGKLSDEPASTYERGRNRRAADGKWQVIISEGSTESMEVDRRDGVLVIPNNFFRSLTRADPPIGVISGAGHEILHVFQIDNIEKNTGSLKLTKAIRGRSSLALREAGGIEIERRLQQTLFGQKRIYNGHYMRGMEAIEQGGSKEEVLQQIYNGYREVSKDTPAEAAKSTYNNLQRLLRKGGYDSQALNYLQAGLIIDQSENISDEARAQLFAEGAYDLHDMVTLHKYGLDDSNPDVFPEDEYIMLAARYMRGRLNEAGS